MPSNRASRPQVSSNTDHARDISRRFAIPGEFEQAELIESGHINSTYRVSYREEGGTVRRYVIQSINPHVFRNPHHVMDNVEKVTRHIHRRIHLPGQDDNGQTLHLLPTREGAFRVEDAGIVWRGYNFIDGCVTHDVVETTRQAHEAARAFGTFQDLVSNLDAASLHETIPDFHNTPLRFQRLQDVAAADPMGRLASVAEEMDFIRARESIIGTLLDHVRTGHIPIRVTHNDTKINNVMMDAQTDQAVCVIDLDTVMPGLSLYDFGDLVRSATSPAAEDEPDLSRVEMRLPIFQALVEGYLGSAAGFLTNLEIDHLVHAGKLMSLEVGIRFLTDYLEGDLYFRTKRPNQNLDRCRTQLQLVRCIELQQPAMESIVRTVAADCIRHAHNL